MTRPDALEFAAGLSRAVNTRDAARLLSLYAEDAVATSPMFHHIAGRAAIAESWRTLFALFPDGWFGQPPTGELTDYRCVILLEVSTGKLIRDERLYDLAGVLERPEKSRRFGGLP